MYAWIWRHIPFRQWQLKAAVSLVLALGIAALLWYQVFPSVEPLLPFDDVQVENDDGSIPVDPAPSPVDPAPGPTGSAPDQLPS